MAGEAFCMLNQSSVIEGDRQRASSAKEVKVHSLGTFVRNVILSDVSLGTSARKLTQ